jgi:hypothetical protein
MLIYFPILLLIENLIKKHSFNPHILSFCFISWSLVLAFSDHINHLNFDVDVPYKHHVVLVLMYRVKTIFFL